MKKRLLLVEDDADDAALFLAALAAPQDVEAEVAPDGEEALRRLSLDPLPDLLVLDLQLPRVTGIEVLQRLRAQERGRRLPVVIFSSSGEPSDRAACYAAGANSFLRKPVSAEEFEKAVRTLETYWLTLNQPPP